MIPAAVRTVLAVPRDHPAYAGHFPGHPILPGVVILAEVMAAIELATARAASEWEIGNAKFLEPVTPGTELVLEHEATQAGGIRFEVRSPTGVVASGTLKPREP
jgi:3-hydroxymyristoyl/3-hydroxydecanoyl-(acyl carrier protein) dehydratase